MDEKGKKISVKSLFWEKLDRRKANLAMRTGKHDALSLQLSHVKIAIITRQNCKHPT